MQIKFDETAWANYLYWQGQDRKTLRRINDLLTAIGQEPGTALSSRWWSP